MLHMMVPEAQMPLRLGFPAQLERRRCEASLLMMIVVVNYLVNLPADQLINGIAKKKLVKI